MDAERAAAVTSLTYLVRSILALPEEQRSGLVGAEAQPWCELLEELTRSLRRDLRPIVVPLLSTLSRNPPALTPEQRALVGTSARRLLRFAWGEDRRDWGAVHAGIEGVCRTFEASPEKSEPLLRRMLEPDHLTEDGYHELPRLVLELRRLLPQAPAFIEAVYRAALTYEEQSDATTSIGGSSLIMPMSSNRRQDYRMALHSLGALFPEFMTVAPVEATGALVTAVEAKVAEHATVPLDSIEGEVIHLGGEPARFAGDLSCIWDRGAPTGGEITLRMLDGFEEGLVGLAGPQGDPSLLTRVLSRVARENRFAAVWRRVLAAATREPAGLGVRVWTLVASRPLLVAADTIEMAGRYLATVFPNLGQIERELVEKAILSIRETEPDVEGRIQHLQDRLIGCLGVSSIVTAEARARFDSLAAAGGAPPNTPLFQQGEVTSEEYTEDRWLADQGVAVEATPNRLLLQLIAPATEIGSPFENQGVTLQKAAAALPDLRALHDVWCAAGMEPTTELS
jgi:hypothetical protein